MLRSILNTIIIYLFLFDSIIFSEEVCKFYYKMQPEKLHDSTIVVPDEMVAMSEYQCVGIPVDTTINAVNAPAIMFVLDNSGSMNMNPGGLDSLGNRYSVTRDLIDTLSKMAPASEIGVAVFNRYLYFDPKDDPIFRQCPEEPVGAYIPLLGLNKNYNGQTGAAVLTKWLECDTFALPLLARSINLKYKPPLTVNETATHINAAFHAVRHAMLSTGKAKANQFVIFISDGAATWPEDNTANNYVQGTNVPTTFTIFFVMTGTSPAQDLVNMTQNIKNNGYSTSNPKSNIWGFKNTSYDTLMKFIMTNVIDLIINQTKYVPINMSINGGQQVNNWDSTGFTFPQLFPLVGVRTDFTFNITYTIMNDTLALYRGIRRDTTIITKFGVMIDPNQGPLPDSFYDVKCWDRTLAFYFNNAPVTSIDPAMSPLQLRFNYTPGAANYNYSQATIEVSNTSANGRDRETITLTKSGNTFTGAFPRVMIADGASPMVGDGTLQHYRSDNITAVFRNNETPKLPLDTLKIQAGFSFGGTVDLVRGFYFDKNAEGYIDSIFVEVTTDIPGGLTASHVQEIVDKALTFPAFRGFTVNSRGLTTGGFFIKVTESTAHTPVTYITADDKLVTTQALLTTGGEVKAGAWPVYDRVAPIIHWAPRSALLRDYKIVSKSDTLGVKFSEPVKSVSSDEPFYFLNRVNNTNYVVKLLAAGHPKADSLVFHVVSVTGVAAMQDGDSLWIHETNRIADDTAGNFQNNTINIKRRLYVDLLYGPITVECGYYFDSNADGYVDSIYVKATTAIEGGLNNSHVAEIVDKAITLPSFRSFTVNSSGVVTGGFFIKVTENRGHNPFTYVTNDDKLIVSTYNLSMGGEVAGGTLPIYDRVAPLIHWEVRAAYLIDYMADTTADTLFIKFSEPVKRATSNEPFYFLDKDNNTNYTVNIADAGQPETDKMVFYVTSVSGVDYMEDGDSVWIKEIDRVSDAEGNYQNNNQNTRRRLYVKKIVLPYTYIPQAVSPISVQSLTTGSNRVPAEIVTVLGSALPDLNLQKNASGDYCGMIIMVVPEPDNIGQFILDLKIRGTLTMLDAVGNTLVLKQPLSWWDQQKSLVYVWNLKNRNGRFVGPGMYVCMFEIEDITESLDYQNRPQKQVKKITIGVK